MQNDCLGGSRPGPGKRELTVSFLESRMIFIGSAALLLTLPTELIVLPTIFVCSRGAADRGQYRQAAGAVTTAKDRGEFVASRCSRGPWIVPLP